ncbi:MAG: Serine protease, subfamily, contains C-terminal domain, partial [Phycisphaerales bacterium]|nr:Serine protease, subfamily, contains C-terminal domain [Phycisphaerales bacterium]
MQGKRSRFLRRFSPHFAALVLFAFAPSLRADQPAAGPTTRPMLDALNRETQDLYREARRGVVRVQLPPSRWMDAYAMAPMNRWDKLDPDLRKKLEQRRTLAQSLPQSISHQRAAKTDGNETSVATTQQSNDTVQIEGHNTIIFVRPSGDNSTQVQQQRDAVLGGKLQMDIRTTIPFTPNTVGMLLDEAGHILVPLYVEREAVGDGVVRVAWQDGEVVDAKFIGSDRQTNLTLLQVKKTDGKPVRLAAERPADGSLVLSLAPGDASGRLALWNGGQQEYGIIFTTDGRAAGIARYGQFLGGSACRLIADQLVRFGSVRRATLGVIITEIRKDDPLREQLPVLGARTAMRVDEVIPGST